MDATDLAAPPTSPPPATEAEYRAFHEARVGRLGTHISERLLALWDRIDWTWFFGCASPMNALFGHIHTTEFWSEVWKVKPESRHFGDYQGICVFSLPVGDESGDVWFLDYEYGSCSMCDGGPSYKLDSLQDFLERGIARMQRVSPDRLEGVIEECAKRA